MIRRTWPDPAWHEQLEAFEAWLDAHPDDPALLAKCRRISLALSGGAR